MPRFDAHMVKNCTTSSLLMYQSPDPKAGKLRKFLKSHIFYCFRRTSKKNDQTSHSIPIYSSLINLSEYVVSQVNLFSFSNRIHGYNSQITAIVMAVVQFGWNSWSMPTSNYPWKLHGLYCLNCVNISWKFLNRCLRCMSRLLNEAFYLFKRPHQFHNLGGNSELVDISLSADTLIILFYWSSNWSI